MIGGNVNYKWNRLGQLMSVTKVDISASYNYDLVGKLLFPNSQDAHA